MLRKLLTRIEMTPVVEDGRRGYRLVADGSFAKLFSGTVLEALPPTVVAPTGPARFELTVPLRTTLRLAA
jgi:hypothetical protein